MKEEVREALKGAEKLEKKKVPTRRDIEKVYRDGMREAEKLRGLLKPAWFVESPRKRKVYKSRRDSDNRR